MWSGSKSGTVPLLLLALAMAGCGGGGGTQDSLEGGAESACPCFSAQDIVNDAQGRSFDACLSSPKTLGLTLQLTQGDAGIVLYVRCPNANFGSCQCEDGVRNVGSDSVTRDQYFSCVGILTDALVNQFSAGSCVIAN